VTFSNLYEVFILTVFDEKVQEIGDRGLQHLNLRRHVGVLELACSFVAGCEEEPVESSEELAFTVIRPIHHPFVAVLGERRLAPFAGANFRMNEFSAGILLAQLRKLDRIVTDVRTNAHRVYEGIQSLPGIELRKRPDPDGELGAGIYIGFKNKERRDAFIAAMKRENILASPPAGSAILPLEPYIQKKVTVHPEWPTFNTERGRAIQYGPASCPRTIAVLDLSWIRSSRLGTPGRLLAIRKIYREVVEG
jgi:DegT/DnrJ/EryC1/StrS aminotransferase family